MKTLKMILLIAIVTIYNLQAETLGSEISSEVNRNESNEIRFDTNKVGMDVSILLLCGQVYYDEAISLTNNLNEVQNLHKIFEIQEEMVRLLEISSLYVEIARKMDSDSKVIFELEEKLNIALNKRSNTQLLTSR